MQHHLRTAFPALIMLSLLVGACASEPRQEEGGHEIETDTGLVRDPTMVDGAQRVEVTLDDYVIEMPDTIPSGVVVFEATNRGTHEHSLEIEGQGVHQALPDPLNPGNTMELTTDLRPGTYRVYCPVDDHVGRGMEKTVVAQE